MNLKPEARKHMFSDCSVAYNNYFFTTAFISLCALASNLNNKSPISGECTTSQAAHELAVNRLEAILSYSFDQH